jgi:hypothetical protein
MFYIEKAIILDPDEVYLIYLKGIFFLEIKLIL